MKKIRVKIRAKFRVCWRCGGTGTFTSGETCYWCRGTGQYDDEDE